MAAYAALTSLKYLIYNLQNHPSPPVSINGQQLRSLTEVATSLQEFLKGYNSSSAYTDEADPLEIRIVDAAYAAEDVIESKIEDQFCSQSTTPGNNSGEDLYQYLVLVIEELDLINKVAMTIQKYNNPVRPELQARVSAAVGSLTSSIMVGFDDVFLEVMESLLGNQLDLQVIPIKGMGGIGKTTLARKLFENACVREHFDIRAWTTISQDYNAQQALKELFNQAKGNSSGQNMDDLGLKLYQHLSGRRYLIIMDDMWSIEVWDNIRCYFPNNKNGSRIIVTTRLSNLAFHFDNGFNMKFLDDFDSWILFSEIVFGEDSFPLELEEIGERIVRNCRGLPLSIVTIGGLLAKSVQTREYWEEIEGNLNSIVNSEDDDYCLRILKMSYNHLPVHLKPCFLYMGVFEEDVNIAISTLIEVWISEGFIEPTSDKTLETIAEENFKELVDRNLVVFDMSVSTEHCRIHDLLRDMCIREAEKCGFYIYARDHFPQDINSKYRVVIHEDCLNEKFLEASQSLSGAISVITGNDRFHTVIRPFKLRLLRTIIASGANSFLRRKMFGFGEDYFLRRNLFELANTRYLYLKFADVRYISSLNLFWNLHTLIIHNVERVTAPIEIWNMPHLRQVEFYAGVYLLDPPNDNDVIMENLQKLQEVFNLKLNQEVVKRIPNIKTLDVTYDEIEPHEDYYCLNYVECLHKLESFGCFSYSLEVDDFVKKLKFPQSLKKLRIGFNNGFELDEMLEKIGALPLLQHLYVYRGFFRVGEWRTVEGRFCKLESLHLRQCGLKRWMLESSHFPRLKKICFEGLEELEEISSEIGDIPTLQRIDVIRSKMSTMMCLKKLVEEQEEFQGEEQLSFEVQVLLRRSELRWEEVVCSESPERCLRIHPHFHSVVVKEDFEALERLKGPNFHIVISYYY